MALALSIILLIVGLYRYFQIKSRLGRYYQRNYVGTQHGAGKDKDKEKETESSESK